MWCACRVAPSSLPPACRWTARSWPSPPAPWSCCPLPPRRDGSTPRPGQRRHLLHRARRPGHRRARPARGPAGAVEATRTAGLLVLPGGSPARLVEALVEHPVRCGCRGSAGHLRGQCRRHGALRDDRAPRPCRPPARPRLWPGRRLLVVPHFSGSLRWFAEPTSLTWALGWCSAFPSAPACWSATGSSPPSVLARRRSTTAAYAGFSQWARTGRLRRDGRASPCPPCPYHPGQAARSSCPTARCSSAGRVPEANPPCSCTASAAPPPTGPT